MANLYHLAARCSLKPRRTFSYVFSFSIIKATRMDPMVVPKVVTVTVHQSYLCVPLPAQQVHEPD
jgi:hypothetical protein